MIEKVLAQNRDLVEKQPNISPFFVPIACSRMGHTLPFLPIRLFRQFHVFSQKTPAQTFISSGSTHDVRARHSFSEKGLARYRQSSVSHFRRFLTSLNIALDTTIISLVPPVESWPQSSLAAMIDMFKYEGLNVCYFDVENEQGLAPSRENIESDIVIFGTSFHHMLMAHRQTNPLADFICGKRVTVIDTGGTKGRTRHFNANQVYELISNTYSSALSCQVVSEYGMCELSSQAWSLNSPHDGWFKANEGLFPLIIDLDQQCTINDDHRPGFLAFIDSVNQDSFMAIITEDLALMTRERPGCFKLLGRAPDASLKGCSLNVKENFLPTTSTQFTQTIKFNSQPKADFSSLSDSISLLPADIWDDSSRQDLLLSLRGIKMPSTPIEQTRDNQRLLLVLSANIPITFLYPAIICAMRGVKEVHLQLPSIRANDSLSERVRAQISTLAECIAPSLHPTSLFLHDDKDLLFSTLKNFDAVLVFGSDETITTFKSALAEQNQTELMGLGSIYNSLMLSPSSKAELVAESCARWLGRGCLTPVALVGDDPYPGFIGDLVSCFDATMTKRLWDAQVDQQFSHRHNILEIEGLLKALKRPPNAHIFRGKCTFIVDLRVLSENELKQSNFSLAAGGCGFLYLITADQLNVLGELKTYPAEPGLFDEHMGKRWTEWI